VTHSCASRVCWCQFGPTKIDGPVDGTQETKVATGKLRRPSLCCVRLCLRPWLVAGWRVFGQKAISTLTCDKRFLSRPRSFFSNIGRQRRQQPELLCEHPLGTKWACSLLRAVLPKKLSESVSASTKAHVSVFFDLGPAVFRNGRPQTIRARKPAVPVPSPAALLIRQKRNGEGARRQR
jgi:hypothetical protein